ncbi:unnamed protein product [Microthlaspi erraticum]|uniref:Uncharacterized protein n=1 Tax=Microthlaspi erraticum TaxID=1685480 RepID=A0A6D2KFW7_9BRAS|nr:unnamed protein product [Microthlaspi erraticum]
MLRASLDRVSLGLSRVIEEWGFLRYVVAVKMLLSTPPMMGKNSSSVPETPWSDGQAHLRMWWEEAITEQFDVLYDELDDMNTELWHIAMDRRRFENLAHEIQVIKDHGLKLQRKSALEFKIAVACGAAALLMAFILAFLN